MIRLIICFLICLILVPAPNYSYRQQFISNQSALLSLNELDLISSDRPDDQIVSQLANTNPVEFLKQCLLRCNREVKSYEAVLYKQERLDGILYPPEKVRVAFQDTPHRVRLEWIEGTRKANKVLYAMGENQDRILIRPAGWLGVVGIVERDPYGPETRQNGRYPLPEFGIKKGMLRTLQAWFAAQERGTLDVRFEGLRTIPQLEGRKCYVFHRTHYDRPEDDGIEDLIVYIDSQTWLQIGSELRDAHEKLIAEYYLTQLRLNPIFPNNSFTRDALRK